MGRRGQRWLESHFRQTRGAGDSLGQGRGPLPLRPWPQAPQIGTNDHHQVCQDASGTSDVEPVSSFCELLECTLQAPRHRAQLERTLQTPRHQSSQWSQNQHDGEPWGGGWDCSPYPQHPGHSAHPACENASWKGQSRQGGWGRDLQVPRQHQHTRGHHVEAEGQA